MRPVDFDYQFPEELIATQSAQQRSQSRLLCFDSATGSIQHRQFFQILDSLNPSDCLVVNQSRVVPARFKAQKTTGAQLEGLLIGERDGRALVWIQGKVQAGHEIRLENGPELRVLDKSDKTVCLDIDLSSFIPYLQNHAYPALPPYIRRARKLAGLDPESEIDYQAYQSLFASEANRLEHSVAAPTASLHFDQSLVTQIQEKGVRLIRVELQVGLGTFEPLEDEELLESQDLHSEKFFIEPESWEQLTRAREESRRIIAVGTTSLRALESAARMSSADFCQEPQETSLFIRPGFDFKIVNSLITNFHQPKSSLLVLVSSFLESRTGRGDLWKKIYSEAIEERYRLFSFGDALWIQ